jgi:hypothetical protein
MSLLRHPALHLLLALLMAAAVLVKPVLFKKTELPQGDAPRYIITGLNLADHGVISDEHRPDPTPTLVAGGPLIALEIAAIALLDQESGKTFRCAVSPRPPEQPPCPLNLTGMKIAHWLELSVFAAGGWILGWLVFRSLPMAWLGFGLIVICRELWTDSGQALTEPLAYTILGFFLPAWLNAWQRPADAPSTPLWWGLSGLSLGLLILIKPSAMAILPLGILLLALSVILGKRPLRGAAWAAALFGLGCLVVLSPWLLRNLIVLGVPALSHPSYLATTLSHRIAYNAMSLQEWLVGWIYYLPDFGDNLAARLFAPAMYERLDWGDSSYYVYGRDQLYPAALKAAPEHTAAYLVRDYVLPDAFKHAAVTLLLAWRGFFVGRLWGLVALVLLAPGLRLVTPEQRRWLLLILLPGLLLLFAQAALSVSITRYNNALVAPLAMIAAAAIGGLCIRAYAAIRR